MSVDRMRIRLVRSAEFVQVRLPIRPFRADLTEIGNLSDDADSTSEPVQRTLLLAFDPHVQIVVAIGNVLHVKHALCVGKAIVRRRQCDHYSAHLRMDVTEDVGDAFSRKYDAARRARLIQPEIETPSIEEGENVVKERIGIRKCYAAAHRHNQQMRREHLVLLQQGKVAGRYRCRDSRPQRVQPDNRRRRFLHLVG